jgi:hypothetical protein
MKQTEYPELENSHHSRLTLFGLPGKLTIGIAHVPITIHEIAPEFQSSMAVLDGRYQRADKGPQRSDRLAGLDKVGMLRGRIW